MGSNRGKGHYENFEGGGSRKRSLPWDVDLFLFVEFGYSRRDLFEFFQIFLARMLGLFRIVSRRDMRSCEVPFGDLTWTHRR